MNIESLTVALRPRSSWEAVELGTALTRRHAAAIWKPWAIQGAAVFALLHLLAWAVDMLWIAAVLLWWLKPLFDRIPLYVLSRAVFGSVPGTAETLRAQWHWGLRWMPAYLTWRRLSPVRAMHLPVDLLEGGRGDDARQRRRALVGPSYGVAALATLLCLNFELALVFGFNVLALLFVPPEHLAATAHTFWETLLQGPTWMDVLQNGVLFLAVSLIEPFYVGAGFGLYLNRRTEIEGWDIEIVLRRLAARLARNAAPLLLAILLLQPGLLQAQAPPTGDRAVATGDGEDPDADADPATVDAPTLPPVFGELADDSALREAVERARADPSVSPRRMVSRWKRIDEAEEGEQDFDAGPLEALFEGIGKVFALLGEIGLWLVAAVLALLLALTARHWWPWLHANARRERREPDGIVHAELPDDAPLPADIRGEVRRLWQAGRRRDALALLYRASVAGMAERAGVTLVPGATEAACLRASRGMPMAEDREAFAAVVRTWQYAAYADRWPDASGFETVLERIADRFGWGAGRGMAEAPR